MRLLFLEQCVDVTLEAVAKLLKRLDRDILLSLLDSIERTVVDSQLFCEIALSGFATQAAKGPGEAFFESFHGGRHSRPSAGVHAHHLHKRAKLPVAPDFVVA